MFGSSEDKKSLPETIEVSGFVVHKLYLGDYVWLISQVESLPKEVIDTFSEIDNTDELDFVQQIARFVPKCMKQFIELMARSTMSNTVDREDEEVFAQELKKRMQEMQSKMDLADVIDMINAVWVLNDFKAIWEKLKKKLPAQAVAYLGELQKVGKSTGSKDS